MKYAFLILIGIIALLASVSPVQADRIIEESVSVADISKLSVRIHTAKVQVTADPSENIQLRIELKPEKGKKPNLESVKLDLDRSGDRLDVSLDIPFDPDDVEQDWTILIPARLVLDVDVKVGKVNVDGITGGLELSVGVGDIRANAPEGRVKGRVGVGDVKVKSSTKSYGYVLLDANVGDTRLSVDGHRVVYSKPPGAGNRVALDGPGRDSFELKTNVGNAELEIN